MNKAILMGRLVRDPELRMTQSNTAVCTFTIAVDRRFKNANGERQADFIPVVAWRQNAEFISRYFRQGSKILIVGSIQRRSWEDNEGRKRYETEVIVEEVNFVDNKKMDGDGNTGASNVYGGTPFTSVTPNESFEKGFDTTKGDAFLDSSDDEDVRLPFEI